MAISDVLRRIRNPANKSLVMAVDDFLTQVEHVPPPNRNTYFRASQMSDMCPREEYLAAKHNFTRKRELSHHFGTACGLGKSFHWWFRNDVLGPMGVLIGKWECNKCYKFVDEQRMPSEPHCTESRWQFVEPAYFDKELMITGHSDGVIRWNLEEMLLELKSANTRGFNEFLKNGPPKYYSDQIQMYLFFSGLKKALLLYQNKDSSKKHQMVIDRDDSRIAILRSKVAAYRNGMDKNQAPDRVCVSSDCPRAQQCQLREICFQKN